MKKFPTEFLSTTEIGGVGEMIYKAVRFPAYAIDYDEEGYDENYLMVFKVNGVWYFNDATNDVSMHYPGKMGYIVEVEE